MHEFGVRFDPEKACNWLKEAALSEDECQENYLARAWCWRFHQALGVTLDIDMATLREWMMWSILRGHRQCIVEAHAILALITDSDERQRWTEGLAKYTNLLNTAAGGLGKFFLPLNCDIKRCLYRLPSGMPHFIPRKLRRDYDVDDLDSLDSEIQAEFMLRGVDSLDRVYVNHRGDGLLHMAAAMGNVAALKHLVEKYNPDINCPNQVKSETPLLCACRGGHLDCALYLLDKGASPDGNQFAAETPLYWLCAFKDEDIPEIARRLVEAGANIRNEGHQRAIRQRPQGVWADPEDMFTLPVSPLSRAVMMQSLPSVRTLLALGADPLEGLSTFSSVCPVVLAAVLTLPRILEVMLLYLEPRAPEPVQLFSDMEMLQISLDLKATIVDGTSLQSRISRCGVGYKAAMFETLEILHSHDVKVRQSTNEGVGSDSRARAETTVVARLVSLGRIDIVDSLLQLRHSVHGKPDTCPLVEAIRVNHESLFRLLVNHGADIQMKLSAPNGGTFSLLQVFADRPTQSPPGLHIPEYLLRMGIAVDPLPDGSRSAFASAVKNQDFGLADLLLKNKADIDFSYSLKGGETPWMTVFGDLIRNPTEKNVDSIDYLLQINRPPVQPPSTTSLVSSLLGIQTNLSSLSLSQNNPLPDPIVCKETDGLTVLHHAAAKILRSDLEETMLGVMVRHILSVERYSRAEVLNAWHPTIGTALGAAAALGNLEVASALIDKGADVALESSNLTPLAIASSRARSPESWPEEWKVDKGRRQKTLKKFMMIVELLRGRTPMDNV